MSRVQRREDMFSQDRELEEKVAALEQRMRLQSRPKIPFPYSSNWRDHSGAGEPVTFWKDQSGQVHMEGIAQNIGAFSFGATTAIIGTFPVGYRPALLPRFIVHGYDSSTGAYVLGQVYVDGNGIMRVWGGGPNNWSSGAANSYGDLSQVNFRAVQ